MVKKNRWRK